MLSYAWNRRRSSYDELVWVSIVRVFLDDVLGRRHDVDAQLDTGAVISVFRRSVAALLGLRLEGGRAIRLRSVAHGELRACVHPVRLAVDAKGSAVVPVAITDREDVPNLLGRHGVFDHFEIVLDPRRRETRLSGPLA